MFLPSFNRGSVLKQNMLEALRDYPRTLLDILYGNYGDGIITGFEIKPVGGSSFEVSPGIVKINDELHISSEIIYVEQKFENQYVYLSVQKTENSDGSDMSMQCVQSTEPNETAFELFRYTRNAEMFEYRDVAEVFNNPINRINQIFCKYGVAGGYTLKPFYYRLFAKAVLDCSTASASDIAFSYQCLNGISSIDIIKQYFDDPSSNSAIIEEMKNILGRLRTNISVEKVPEERIQTPKKMVIS